MQKLTLELPTMYGDHHVVEVRRILHRIPGVEEVYASSAFHTVEVSYDPSQVNDLDIQMKLDEAGYLGEWSVPIELDSPQYVEENTQPFFRHTQVYETVRQTVSFSQTVPEISVYAGRPLWSCPGLGVIRNMEE